MKYIVQKIGPVIDPVSFSVRRSNRRFEKKYNNIYCQFGREEMIKYTYFAS